MSSLRQDEQILTRAGEWLLELQSPDVPAERIAAWQQWLGRNERHARAFDELQRTWNISDCLADAARESLPWPTQNDGSSATLALKNSGAVPYSKRLRWARDLMAAAVLAALVLGAAVWLIQRPSAFQVHTVIGEHRELRLADGSIVWIGAGSQLRIAMRADERMIELEHGEAYFQVAKDPLRPFRVRAGSAAVTAVGTAFNVRRSGPKRIVVGVSEGAVTVSPEGNSLLARIGIDRQEALRLAANTRLIAGERLVLEPGLLTPPKIEVVAPRAVASWREGRLQYSGEPLEVVIADVNRYIGESVVIADPAVATLRVTGTVAEASIESWFKSLQASLPIDIVKGDDGRLEVHGRRH